MGNKQLMYLLIGLTTVLILVGIANLYFINKQSGEEISEKIDGELIPPDETTEYQNESLTEENAAVNNQRQQTTQPQSGGQAEIRTRTPAESNQSQTTPRTGTHVREFNIRTWVNRSIPLTFESGTEASENIRRQYAHVVRDLERVQQLLLQEKADEALQLIRPMLNDRGNIYREDAEWYHILALFAAGNNESGFNQLNRLLRDNIHLFYFLGTELQAEMVSIQALIQQSAGKSGTQPKDAW
ncbi:MAG: hypothetical protein EA362_12175 [Saprospirales bacterium]|nr:MAG: hypothetical protein EA362_12175 [Saprospirales bacterium]